MRSLLLIVVVVLCCGVAALAEEKPGLIVTIKPRGATGAGDTRVDRLIALRVPAGEAATPFVAPGPVDVTWRGHLNLPIRTRAVFAVEGRGKVKLTIEDKVILEGEVDGAKLLESERARIGKGANPIVFEYTGPADGDAWVRLTWSGSDFPREAVPPMVFSHDDGDADAAIGVTLRRGRELFAQQRCIKCHLPDGDFKVAATAMPELMTDAPSLEGVADRLNTDWIAVWIANPSALRHAAQMPSLFGHASAAEADKADDTRPWDIAAYLATLRNEPDASTPPPSAAQIKTGGGLFAQLGCIACHTRPDADADAVASDEHGRIPLRYIGWKYRTLSHLAAFLKQPNRNYLHVRMPDLHLTDDEANSLAAFLVSKATARLDVAGAPKGDAKKGAELVATAGCVNCHGLKVDYQNKAPSLKAVAAADWSAKGCAADDASKRGAAPLLNLSAEDRAAVRAFGQSPAMLASLNRTAPAEAAQRLTVALRCNACHDRDGVQDRWSLVEKEVADLAPAAPAKPAAGGDASQPAQLAQSRPALTWLGEKLNTDWTRGFIAGKTGYRVRPWLTARMPAFPAYADPIANGLALQHGMTTTRQEPTPPDNAAELAKIGRKLTGPIGGFACITCHSINKMEAIARFEVGGPNLMYVTERLRHDYFLRWMLNPPRVDPTTKMPKYADDSGRTALSDTLDGDAAQQFEAIWQYLQAGRKIEPPSMTP
ncbi:MAG: c-type cytochrome [Phycisphaera sp.]|nr:c-type cytochrome [Phycisphaera sp.]